MADRLDFSHDIDIIDPNKTRLLGFNENPEGVRSEYGNLSVAEILAKPEADIAGFESQLADAKTKLSDAEKRITVNERDIKMLKLANEGTTYTVEEDATEAYSKTVPSGNLGHATIERLEGKNGTTKNLLNPTLANTTLYGVTCTKNGDGTYTLNGTASDANAMFRLEVLTLPAGTYKLVGSPKNGSVNTYGITWYGSNYDIGRGKQFVVSSEETRTPYIFVTRGATVSNLVFKPMITTDLTATYDDYEPYFAGIRNYGTQKVVSRGKNIGEVTKNSASTDYTDILKAKIPNFANGKKYTISFDSDTGFFAYTNENLFDIEFMTIHVGKNSIKVSPTAVLDETNGAIYDNGWRLIKTRNNITKTITLSNIQIEEGEVATDYSPFIPPQTYSLASIKSKVDSAFGEGAYGREGTVIDWKEKMVTVSYGDVDIGSENWGLESWGANNTFYFLGLDVVPKNESGHLLSSLYQEVSPGTMYNTVLDKVICLNVSANGGNRYIRVIDSSYTSASDFKSAMAGKHLIYELATPLSKTFEELGITEDLWLNTESNGSLEFVSAYEDIHMPVKSTVKYPTKVSEAIA